MTIQSAVINKKYYEFEMDSPVTVGNGFVFEGSYYGVTAVIEDGENDAQFMKVMQLYSL